MWQIYSNLSKVATRSNKYMHINSNCVHWGACARCRCQSDSKGWDLRTKWVFRQIHNSPAFFSDWTRFSMSFQFFSSFFCFVHKSKLENVLFWGAKTDAQSNVTFSDIGIFGIVFASRTETLGDTKSYKVLSIRLGVDWNWTVKVKH